MNVAHAMTNTLDDFGARLAEERKRIGLQLHEMAHLCGVTDYMQKRFENGTSVIPIDYLQALDARCDASVIYIINGAQRRNNES